MDRYIKIMNYETHREIFSFLKKLKMANTWINETEKYVDKLLITQVDITVL